MACLQPPLVSILKTGSQGFSPFPIEPELDVHYLINKKRFALPVSQNILELRGQHSITVLLCTIAGSPKLSAVYFVKLPVFRLNFENNGTKMETSVVEQSSLDPNPLQTAAKRIVVYSMVVQQSCRYYFSGFFLN
jgi:hypothetical protein